MILFRENVDGWVESDKTRSDTSHSVTFRFDRIFNISDVCDALLDKSVHEQKRNIRAEAILMIGRIFRATERDASRPSDNGDYVFEQLLASSQKKKKKNGPSQELK